MNKAIENAIAEMKAKGMKLIPPRTKEQKMDDAIERINKHDEAERLKYKERTARDSGAVSEQDAIDEFYAKGNKVD